MKIEHETIKITTHFKCSVERLFKALTTEETKKHWYTKDDKAHDLVEFKSDMNVGGKEYCAIVLNEKTPVPGMKIDMFAECMAREDNKTLVLSSRMESQNMLLSLSLETFQFSSNGDGAILDFICQGTFFENSDGPNLRRQGWESMFDFLKGTL